jgi:phage shock protein E
MNLPIIRLLTCLAFSPLALHSQEAKPIEEAPVAVTEIKHTSGKEAKALLDANTAAVAEGKGTKITIIDVRTPAEFAEGHIAEAKNIDLRSADFAKALAQLDKTKPYLVHCAGGHRSTTSLDTFKKLGFKTLIHLDGGLTSWTKEGHPIVK